MIDVGKVVFDREFTRMSPFGSTIQATYISSLVANHISDRDEDPVSWETKAGYLDLVIQEFCSTLIPPPGKSIGSFCGSFGMIMT